MVNKHILEAPWKGNLHNNETAWIRRGLSHTSPLSTPSGVRTDWPTGSRTAARKRMTEHPRPQLPTRPTPFLLQAETKQNETGDRPSRACVFFDVDRNAIVESVTIKSGRDFARFVRKMKNNSNNSLRYLDCTQHRETDQHFVVLRSIRDLDYTLNRLRIPSKLRLDRCGCNFI